MNMVRKMVLLQSGMMILTALLWGGCATSPKHLTKPVTPVSQDHFAEITRPDIPLQMNDRVQDWLDYFQGPSRDRFARYLARSAKYIPMMKGILRQHGLPEGLVYLSMIESGFNPHAYSRSRATGAWQFIYRTGLRYGLKVDSWIDERRDPEKSTVAAAKYLKDLYDRFNNWYLAAASYNAGEGKINRAIRKYATEDFWELSERRFLKKETKNYVPKLIAASLISMNPAKYGFKDIEYEEPVHYEEVVVDAPIDLRVAARCAGVTYEEVKGLNPELIHWTTPPDLPEYRLKLPKGTAEKFRENLALLPPETRMGDQKIQVTTPTTITKLARRHHIHPTLLAVANGLSTTNGVKRGESLIRPYDPPEGEIFTEQVYERRRHGGGVIAYRVRQGDNIQRISRRTGMNRTLLRKSNPQVDWDNLKQGERLQLARDSSRHGVGVKKISGMRRLRHPHRRLKAQPPQTASAGAATSM